MKRSPLWSNTIESSETKWSTTISSSICQMSRRLPFNRQINSNGLTTRQSTCCYSYRLSYSTCLFCGSCLIGLAILRFYFVPSSSFVRRLQQRRWKWWINRAESEFRIFSLMIMPLLFKMKLLSKNKNWRAVFRAGCTCFFFRNYFFELSRPREAKR